MSEEWRDVMGFESRYQVSDEGQVRRIAPGLNTYVGKILKLRLLKGYPSVVLHTDGRPVYRYIHALVAEAFLGLRPNGCEVNHKNGDKTDNRVDNLEWVTKSENALHALHVLGTKCVPPTRGEANGRAKLTELDVLEIRRLYEMGAGTQQQLAQQYEVHQETVGYVVRRKTWAWLPG